MNQNYNTPVFVLDVSAIDDVSEALTAAFKKQYPTYREAELFALAGGSVFVRDELEADGTITVFYIKGDISVFSPSSGGSITITISDSTFDVEYGDSDEGGEGGGEGGGPS